MRKLQIVEYIQSILIYQFYDFLKVILSNFNYAKGKN